MYPTIPFIEEKFKQYNKEYFNNELPTPTFMLFHPKTTLGQFESTQRLDPLANAYHKYIIRMSTYYDRTEHDVDETLIHEMVHFFIDFKGIEDNGSHGKKWKALAEEINAKGNWNISRTTSIANCPINPLYASEKDAAKCKVCVYAYHNKKSGVWFVFISSLSKRNYYESWLKKEVESGKFIDKYIVSTAPRNNGFIAYSLCKRLVKGHEHTEQSLKEIIIPRLDDSEQILTNF